MKLILIRGLPGSGKSTLAKTFVEKGFQNFEADMFFLDKDGNYNYDASRIKNAHVWCKNMCENCLKYGENVVISNTFTRLWEMNDYLKMARYYKADVEILETQGNFQNVHGVPAETIEKMRLRWEPLK